MYWLMQRISAMIRPAAAATAVQTRGIRVQVRDGNVEQALRVMERRMRSSGMERLIKRQVEHHIKNSEKKVLARKNLMLKVRSQEMGRKLKAILMKKLRDV
ncbi:hypothetical protein LUZ60_006532 [Juncus effusus]|nr:hypothetical protein LUZ60_006532 [Juncus effusus]